MSKVNMVYNKSSKQLLSLTKTLKDNKALEDRVVESLLVKRNVETIKKRKFKHKFIKHPDPLTSDSELSIQPVTGYSESSLCFDYNKSCDISVTRSEHSVLSSNVIKRSKSPPHKYLSPNQSCSEAQITVRSHKMEIREKEIVESICLKKTNHHAVQNTNKLKPHAPSSKIRPVTSKLCCKVDLPNKCPEAAKSALQKRNIDHKLRSYLQRIACSLEDIRAMMAKGIEPPDGDEEWERIEKRTGEFSARFSRNYLYQLGREMHALQEISRKSGSISNRSAINIHHRLFSAHQIVLQAFQTYRNHMATLLPNVLVEKLQYVIEQTYTLCDIHTKFLNLDQTGSSKRETLIDVVTHRCDILLDKTQECIEKNGQIRNSIHSPSTKLSLMGYNMPLKKLGKPKPRKKAALEARLSMYSIASGIRTKDAFWRKTVESLAKDKLRYNHVQSRYKTAAFKHRPPTEKPTVIELPTKSKLFAKRSSCLLKNTPISSPHNEDNILTMVEIEKEKECNISNVPKNAFHEQQSNNVNKDVKNVSWVADCEQQSSNAKDMQLQALTPLIQGLCQQVCAKDGEAMTQKQLEILLKGLLGMALDGKINNDKETGSKKNGFAAQNNTVHEMAQKILQNSQQIASNLDANANLPILSKNDEPHGEISEKETEIVKKKIESEDGVVENRKSLDKILKNLQSNTVVSEKIDGSTEERGKNKNNNEETPKTNKVEFDEISISKTKKSDSGQMNKNKRRQTVTVTGAKNAQLICIRDDNSIIESPNGSKSAPIINKNNEPGKDSCSTKEIPVLFEPGEITRKLKKNTIKLGSTNNTATSKSTEVNSARSPKVNIKISRLPKKLLKKLVLVPKTQAFNVIQYKFQYNKFTKGNQMYRKSSKVQPWVIVDRISEHLLNDLLLSVAREIQVDHILESLYHAEFQ